MAITTCPKGHRYDDTINDYCPQCASEGADPMETVAIGGPNGMPGVMAPTEAAFPGATERATANAGFDAMAYDPGPARYGQTAPCAAGADSAA